MAKYVHAQKAIHALDFIELEATMEQQRSRKYKLIKTKDLNFASWDAVRPKIVLAGLLEKFKQTAEASELLKHTGRRFIVCAGSLYDIEGTGLELMSLDNIEPKKWMGHNDDGKLLMDVRTMV